MLKIKTDSDTYNNLVSVESMHCMADGLFRSLKSGDKDVSFKISSSSKIFTYTWESSQLLGIPDQSVFLALHSLLKKKTTLDNIQKTILEPINAQAMQLLNIITSTPLSKPEIFRTSLSEIALELNTDRGGKNLKLIKESLARLSQVLVTRSSNIDHFIQKTNLFSVVYETNGIFIGVSPFLSEACLIGPGAWINMNEQQSLTSDVAKRLHLWLSSWMKSGETRKLTLDLLIPHIWTGSINDSSTRSRRCTLRKALAQLNLLNGWFCVEELSHISITRPKLQRFFNNPISNMQANDWYLTLDDKNAELLHNTHYLTGHADVPRVIVVSTSSKKSEGLSDFLSIYERSSVYKHKYALFRIEPELGSYGLVNILESLHNENICRKNDYLVIVRGGGDITDSSFNVYQNNMSDPLLQSLSDSGTIIITGLGHSQDKFHIENYVTHSCITPTDAGYKLLELLNHTYLPIYNMINIY